MIRTCPGDLQEAQAPQITYKVSGDQTNAGRDLFKVTTNDMHVHYHYPCPTSLPGKRKLIDKEQMTLNVKFDLGVYRHRLQVEENGSIPELKVDQLKYKQDFMPLRGQKHEENVNLLCLCFVLFCFCFVFVILSLCFISLRKSGKHRIHGCIYHVYTKIMKLAQPIFLASR